MERLGDLEAFLAVLERGSQTAAARHLGRSLQSINRSLAALEQGLGVTLIQRTTRRSGPTEAGLHLYERIKPALATIREAQRETAETGAEPLGLLRIGSPITFAAAHVAPACCEFLARYPQVEIELVSSDQAIDLMESGLDVALRIRELPDSTLKARRLGDLRVVVFGAPGYFARHGRPRHPDELSDHQCVVRIAGSGPEPWPFRIGAESRSVRVNGRFRTDSAAAAITAVEEGLGLGLAPLWQIRDLVDRGAVEIVLADFEAAGLPIHAVFPPPRPSLKARLFTDLLAARLRRECF